MNKQYMDFVPTKPTKKTVTKTRSVAKPAATTHKETKISHTPSSNVLSGSAKLGIVEDLTPKATRKEAPARSTAPTHFAAKKSELKEAKAKKVTKTSEEPKKLPLKKEDKSTYTPPKTNFINQDKVTKRPLSKNVYRKKPEPVKEEKKAPVTIIAKPEKDTKVGLIVTIILTIILGAAAGTVAFLLLPK